MWVSYLRDEYLHHSNTTIAWSVTITSLKTSPVVLPHFLMFDHVLTFSSTHARVLTKTTVRMTAFDYIPHTSEIAAVCTEHAANIVCEHAGKVDYQFKQDPHEDMFELSYKDHKHLT